MNVMLNHDFQRALPALAPVQHQAILSWLKPCVAERLLLLHAGGGHGGITLQCLHLALAWLSTPQERALGSACTERARCCVRGVMVVIIACLVLLSCFIWRRMWGRGAE